VQHINMAKYNIVTALDKVCICTQ